MATINIPNGKKVLVVEDNHFRNQWFRDHIPGVTIAETVDEALEALNSPSTPMYDLVFLDHDAANVFVDRSDHRYNDLTFWRVAEELAQTNFPGIVIIHSHNPVGAARMAKLLRTRQSGTVFIQRFGSININYGGQR